MSHLLIELSLRPLLQSQKKR